MKYTSQKLKFSTYKNGTNITISDDGYWELDGVETDQKAQGTDGVSFAGVEEWYYATLATDVTNGVPNPPSWNISNTEQLNYSADPISIKGATPFYLGTEEVKYDQTGNILSIKYNTSKDEVYYRFMQPDANNLYGLIPGKTYVISGRASVALKDSQFTSLNVRGQYHNGTKWCDSVNIPIIYENSGGTDFSVRFTINPAAKGYYISFQVDREQTALCNGTITFSNLSIKEAPWVGSIQKTNFGTKNGGDVTYKYLWNVEVIKATNSEGTESSTTTEVDLMQTYTGGRVPVEYISYYAAGQTSEAPGSQPKIEGDCNTITIPSDSSWIEAKDYKGSADANTYLFEITFIKYAEKDEEGKNLYAQIGPTIIGRNGADALTLVLDNDNDIIAQSANGQIIGELPTVNAAVYLGGVKQTGAQIFITEVPKGYGLEKPTVSYNGQDYSFSNNTLTIKQIPENFIDGYFVFKYNDLTVKFHLRVVQSEVDYNLNISQTLINSSNSNGTIYLQVKKTNASGKVSYINNYEEGDAENIYLYVNNSQLMGKDSWQIGYSQGESTPIIIQVAEQISSSNYFFWDTETIEFVHDGKQGETLKTFRANYGPLGLGQLEEWSHKAEDSWRMYNRPTDEHGNLLPIGSPFYAQVSCEDGLEYAILLYVRGYPMSEEESDEYWQERVLTKNASGYFRIANNGYSQRQIALYQRAESEPIAPANNAITYNFATKTFSFPQDCPWTEAIPNPNGNPCYVTYTFASTQTPSTPVSLQAWSNPIIFVQDGAGARILVLDNDRDVIAIAKNGQVISTLPTITASVYEGGAKDNKAEIILEEIPSGFIVNTHYNYDDDNGVLTITKIPTDFSEGYFTFKSGDMRQRFTLQTKQSEKDYDLIIDKTIINSTNDGGEITVKVRETGANGAVTILDTHPTDGRISIFRDGYRYTNWSLFQYEQGANQSMHFEIREGSGYQDNPFIWDEETVEFVLDGAPGSTTSGDKGDQEGTIIVYQSVQWTGGIPNPPTTPSSDTSELSGWQEAKISPSTGSQLVYACNVTKKVSYSSSSSNGVITYSNWGTPYLIAALSPNINITSSNYADFLKLTNFETTGAIKHDSEGNLMINADYIKSGVLSVTNDNGETIFTASKYALAENGSTVLSHGYVNIGGFYVTKKGLAGVYLDENNNNMYVGISLIQNNDSGWPKYTFFAGAKNEDGHYATFHVERNGSIFASKGTIGGWYLDLSYLRSSDNKLFLHTSTWSKDISINGVTSKQWRIIAGTSSNSNDTPDSTNFYAKFGITNTGVLSATEAHISGTIHSENGEIGGWSISENSLTCSDGMGLYTKGANQYGPLGNFQVAFETSTTKLVKSYPNYRLTTPVQVSQLTKEVNITGTYTGMMYQYNIDITVEFGPSLKALIGTLSQFEQYEPRWDYNETAWVNASVYLDQIDEALQGGLNDQNGVIHFRGKKGTSTNESLGSFMTINRKITWLNWTDIRIQCELRCTNPLDAITKVIFKNSPTCYSVDGYTTSPRFSVTHEGEMFTNFGLLGPLYYNSQGLFNNKSGDAYGITSAGISYGSLDSNDNSSEFTAEYCQPWSQILATWGDKVDPNYIRVMNTSSYLQSYYQSIEESAKGIENTTLGDIIWDILVAIKKSSIADKLTRN